MSQLSLPRAPKRGPRLDPEKRLMNRFYEPLVLQHVLDRNAGQRISRCPSSERAMSQLTLQELRRTFQEQLAYVCDHIKGGDTVTAIGLEGSPSSVTFWVACNTQFSAKMMFFLQGVLDTLQNYVLSDSEHLQIALESDIKEQCIKFNLNRIKKYQTEMLQSAKQCIKVLAKSDDVADKSLADWLKRFRAFDKDLSGLCCHAYLQRSDPMFKELHRLIGDDKPQMTNDGSTRQHFVKTRHFIGRLGSHSKAAKILTMAGQRLPHLFENFTIQTLPSPKPASLPPPTDHMTTLEGIVKRMLPSSGGDTKRYQDALATMNTKFGIQDRLLALYNEKEFRPRVHAELILVEHFYQNRLPFFDDDKFIGCSKPACYCCYHYITLHPGGFVRPASHDIRYLSWRTPDSISDTDEEKKHLRDMMNKIIPQVRRDALHMIDKYQGPSAWRSDSTTGITYSVDHGGFRMPMASTRLTPAQEEAISNVVNRSQEDDIPNFSGLSLSDSVIEEENSDSDGGATLHEVKRRGLKIYAV